MHVRIDRRVVALGFSLGCALALASGASAQPRVEEKANIAVTGDIKAIDPVARKITIESTHDKGVVYDVDGAATIMSGAKKLTLSDLKVGWNVVVNGHDLRGAQTLTYIKVVKAPAP
jgi:Cu/Ag efflux protein CusF